MASVLAYSTSTGDSNWKPDNYDYYHAACVLDHVYKIAPGSELEKQAKARTESLDALRIKTEECPDCIHHINKERRHNREYLDMGGCPINGIECKDPKCGCAEDRTDMPDSKYDDQLISYTQQELDADDVG